jgi:hypothetical protein
MTTRQERQAQFAKLDARMHRLHAEHPLWFALLSLAVGLVMFAITHFLSKGQQP